MTDRVVVLGNGIVELAAALDFAQFGIPVTVITERGAERRVPKLPQTDPQGVLTGWITEVGEPLRAGADAQCRPEKMTHAAGWVRKDDAWVKLPTDSVFGIPSSPLSVEVSQAIGTRGALRAYLDRVKPVLTIGKAQFVADLVTKRLGHRVLDTFVQPQVDHLFGRPSTAVEVAVLAPGLNEAVTRVGSLSGGALAYLDRYAETAGGVAPDIGWNELSEMLDRRLELHGVRFVTVDGPVRVTETLSSESAKPRWLVERGSDSWSPEILVSAAELAAETAVRTEISFVHARPVWWPGTREPQGVEFALSQLGAEYAGWTFRTTMIDAERGVTEIRSGAGVTSGGEMVEAEIAGLLAAAGFAEHGPLEVSISVGVPLAAVEAPVAAESGPLGERAHHVDTQLASSERALEGAISRVRERVKTLRREVLGLV